MSIIDSLVEVRLVSEDDFLKIRETLTRIGVASRKDRKLYQSCHILHKQGRYYIVHFKELFMLDGKPSNFSEEDKLFWDAFDALKTFLIENTNCTVLQHPELEADDLVTTEPFDAT